MTLPLDLSVYFSGVALNYSATGLPEGLVIDPETGIVSGALAMAAISTVTVTVSNQAGEAVGVFNWTVEEAATIEPPVNGAPPEIEGVAEIGATLTATAGSWSGAPDLAFQWLRDGVEIAGAASAGYSPVAGDDRADITVRVTAMNEAGSASAESAATTVRRKPPSSMGALADQVFDADSGARMIDAAGDFSDAEGGVWSVAGAGAAIDEAGVVTIPTDAPVAGAVVTVSYTNSGGVAVSSFEVTVAAAATSITVDSASVRFPEANISYSDAGNFGAFRVPNFGPNADKIYAADGCLMLALSLPVRSLMPASASWSRAKVGLFGNGGGLGQTVGMWLEPSSNENSVENVLRFYWMPSSGATVVEGIEIGTATSVLFLGRRVGADFFVEAYSKGALVGRKTLALPGTSKIRSDLLLGACSNASSTTPFSGGRYAHFTGEIAFLGYTDEAVSEADCLAISAGADPETQIASWRYGVKPTSATTLTPFADTGGYGDMTKLGTSAFRKGGDVMPANIAGDWFAMDQVNEGVVWSVAPGEATSTITLSGEASGITGTVEARYFDADGTLRKDWTVLTGSTIAAGAWAGTMTAPLGAGWGHVETRPTSAPAMLQRSRTECGVGYDIFFLGQSQVERVFDDRTRDVRAPAGVAVSAVVQVGPVADQTVAQVVLTPDARVGDGVAGASAYIASVTNAPVRLLTVAKRGTSPAWMMDDALESTQRSWIDTKQVVDVSGSVSGVMVMNWGTAFLNHGNIAGGFMDPLLTGAAPIDASYTVDHWLYDGTFPATMAFAISPITPHIKGVTGPLDAQVEDGFTQGWQMQNANAQLEAYCAANSLVWGPPTYGVIIEQQGGPHEDADTLYGHERLVIRMVETAFRAFGVSAVADPTLGAAARSDATLTIPATLPNGGTLQTAWTIAGETPPAGWPTVQGFEVSEDGGATWSNGNTETGTAPVEFTAEISGSDVVLTRAAGSWAAGTKWRYAWQAPLDYGRAAQTLHLQHGLLYEGDGDGLGPIPQLAAEGGIGTPVRQASGTAS